MNRWFIAIVFVLAGTNCVFGQSEADLKAHFSKLSAYEVGPGIIMIAKFDHNGHASSLIFQKDHVTPGVVDLGSTLSRPDIIKIVETIIPEAERGKRIKSPLGDYLGNYGGTTFDDGTTADTEYRYENITVIFYGAIGTQCSGDTVAIVRWRGR